jgi:ATP-binding protein involved in chromosome partitioning
VSDKPARFVVAVGSGKGGVGKSTVSLQLALALARHDLSVGLLDADLYGPDIPLMVNLSRAERARQWDFWRRGGDVRREPLERYGIRIMSVGFLVGERQAFTMPALLLTAALKQLIDHVDWGSPDILLIDLPPGTADLQQQLLSVVSLDGAVTVVGPQDVAHLDARRFVDFLRDADVRVLGAIENMSGLVCPHCGETVEVFAPVAEDRSIWSDGILRLGQIPLDPTLGKLDGAAPGNVRFDLAAANLLEALERLSTD